MKVKMKMKREELEFILDTFISELKSSLSSEDDEIVRGSAELIENFYFERKQILLDNTNAALRGEADLGGEDEIQD